MLPVVLPKVCFCGAMYKLGDRWAQCVRLCGFWVCSYRCGETLQRLPCSGYSDPRRQVGFVSFGPCKIVPWKLMLNELIPVNVSQGQISERLPRVLFLWPDVASLYSTSSHVRRDWDDYLGRAVRASAATRRQENKFLHKVLRMAQFCLESGRRFILVQPRASVLQAWPVWKNLASKISVQFQRLAS